MSGILDEIRTEQRTGKRCSLQSALLSLNEEDRKETLEAISNPAITSAAITRVLKRRGFSVQWALRQCRTGCECGLIKPKVTDG